MATSIAPTQSISFPASNVGRSAAAISPERSVPAPVKSEPAPREGSRPIRSDFQPGVGVSSPKPSAQQVTASYQAAESEPKSSSRDSSPPVDRSV